MIDSILAEIRPKLRRFSRILPERFRDDATQEATIVVWREADRVVAANNPQAYAMQVGRKAILRFASERAATGAPSRSRGTGRLFTRMSETISSEALREAGVELSSPAPDLDTALDVEAALGRLSPEDSYIVFARFWQSLSWREVGELTDLSISGVFNRWDRTIRPTLASVLEP